MSAVKSRDMNFEIEHWKNHENPCGWNLNLQFKTIKDYENWVSKKNWMIMCESRSFWIMSFWMEFLSCDYENPIKKNI